MTPPPPALQDSRALGPTWTTFICRRIPRCLCVRRTCMGIGGARPNLNSRNIAEHVKYGKKHRSLPPPPWATLTWVVPTTGSFSVAEASVCHNQMAAELKPWLRVPLNRVLYSPRPTRYLIMPTPLGRDPAVRLPSISFPTTVLLHPAIVNLIRSFRSFHLKQFLVLNFWN